MGQSWQRRRTNLDFIEYLLYVGASVNASRREPVEMGNNNSPR